MKLRRVWICAALLLPRLLLAHGDEVHAEAPVPVPVSAAAPTSGAAAVAPTQAARVEAASEQFELVGLLQGDKLVLYLDRFASNEPVAGAKIDVEGGPLKATAAAEQDGVYTVPAAALAQPGTHALVFTVQAGAATDLLTGELLVAAPAGATAAPHTSALLWLVAAALLATLILGAGVFAWRRRRAPPAGVPQ